MMVEHPQEAQMKSSNMSQEISGEVFLGGAKGTGFAMFFYLPKLGGHDPI